MNNSFVRKTVLFVLFYTVVHVFKIRPISNTITRYTVCFVHTILNRNTYACFISVNIHPNNNSFMHENNQSKNTIYC